MKNIWVPLSGAIAQQRKVDTIANNVANANTPGFKRDEIVFKEYLTALEKNIDQIDLPRKEWAPEDFYRSQGAENSKVKVDASYSDFRQGQLTPTQNPLDVALQGKAFFEILTPTGIRYSRKGNFTIDNEGFLVTTDGHKVLKSFTPPEDDNANIAAGENPKTLQPDQRTIQLNKSRVTFMSDGKMIQNGNEMGQLSLVQFKDIHALRKQGNSLFINPDENNIAQTPSNAIVYQGFIEESNVNAVNEMSNLIKAHRHFESIQKAIRAYDDITGRAVNDIGKF